MNTQQRRSALLLSATSGLFGWVVMAAPVAYASCAGPPEPSPYAFVGRVVATASHDRVATIRTITGQTVEVLGTPSPAENSLTSVDRTYVVRAWYEFHPIDGTDPYEDNACTATERLRGDDIPASSPDSGTGADVDPAPESDNDLAVAGVIAGVAVASGGGGWWLRRRRGSQGPS